MVLRILKATFKIVLLFAFAFAVAFGFNMAMDNLLFSDFDIYGVAFIVPVETEFGYNIIRALFFLFYDTTVRYVVILALILVPYSLISLNTVDEFGRSFSNTVLADVKYYIGKVITFEKESWFWGLCFFTGFVPILAPLVLWIILRLLYAVVLIVLSPIIFIIVQGVNAVRGSVA